MWFIILSILLLGRFVGTSDVVVLARRKEFWSAEFACRDRGRGWYLLDGFGDQKNLTNIMTAHNMTSAWTGVRQKKLDNCQWVDGTKDSSLAGKQTDNQCGAFSLEHLTFLTECTEETVGYICELSKCPKNVAGQLCLPVENSAFLIGCTTNNWYQARDQCLKSHGNLAVFNRRNHIITALQNKLATQLSKLTCTSFYVGFHCQDWFTYRDGEFQIVQSYRWDVAQPSNDHYDCVKLVLDSKGETRWHTADCHSKNSIICQKRNSSYDLLTSTEMRGLVTCPTVPNDTIREKVEECKDCPQQKSAVIGLAILFIFACSATVAVSLFYFSKRLRSKKNEQNQTPPNVEVIPLAEIDNPPEPGAQQDPDGANLRQPENINQRHIDNQENEQGRLLPIGRNNVPR